MCNIYNFHFRDKSNGDSGTDGDNETIKENASNGTIITILTTI